MPRSPKASRYARCARVRTHRGLAALRATLAAAASGRSVTSTSIPPEETTDDDQNSGADLIRLGDELEAAAERSLTSARRRRIGRIGIGVVVLTVLAAGTAVATGMFSPRQIAAGLPAGAVIFGGTIPTCALDGTVTFHCTLAKGRPRKCRTFSARSS